MICYLLSEYQEREIQEKSKKEPVEKEQDIENEGRQREKESSDDRLRRNALIVAPASLVYNWHSELERFAPRLAVRMIVGTAAQRRTLLEAADEGEILITSYDLLRRDIDFYKRYRFRCQIIDEAQYIKNHSTQAAKAVKKIQADTRFALTGTPVENRLSELWSIFDYLMPGFLYSYSRFREELEVQIVQHESEEASERLRKMIRPFVLRRLKKDVLRDLPEKLEENMYTRLEGEQQKLYDAHVKRMKLLLDKQSEEEFNTSKIVILSELTKLRQICCDPALLFEEYKGESAKLEMCVDLIRNAVENGHKILVFSQFTTMLSRLADRLENEETAYYMLTGSTGKEKRAKLVEEFNKEDNPTAVFLISLKAGDVEEIKAIMKDLTEKRVSKQPLEYPSAGSTFKRPEGYFAGKLIMDAGLRGYQVGGAQVSEKHCGFVINKGNATAADVCGLMKDVQEKVQEQFGVTLEPEVKFLGEF